MTDLSQLTAYSDIRKFVSRDAFTATMRFLAWHNRLKMTHMLPKWQALAVAFVAEQKPLDTLWFNTIKTYLAEHTEPAATTTDDCRALATHLLEEMGKNG